MTRCFPGSASPSEDLCRFCAMLNVLRATAVEVPTASSLSDACLMTEVARKPHMVHLVRWLTWCYVPLPMSFAVARAGSRDLLPRWRPTLHSRTSTAPK